MKNIFTFVLLCLILVSCSKKPVVDPDSTPPPPSENCSGPAKTFAADVNPIIQSSCAASSGCHGIGSTSGPGALVTYTQISNARASIRSSVFSGSMPRNGTLTTAQKNAIICWIDNGAPNN